MEEKGGEPPPPPPTTREIVQSSGKVDELNVSLSSGARLIFAERNGEGDEEERASLSNRSPNKDSFSMEHESENNAAAEGSTDTGISSAPMDVLSEEGRAPPVALPPTAPAPAETQIVIDPAPEEEAATREDELETPSPPPAPTPMRRVGIRLASAVKNNRVNPQQPEDKLNSGNFWEKLAQQQSPSSAVDPSSSAWGNNGNNVRRRSNQRRFSDERNLKTAKGIRRMRKKVSVKSGPAAGQGKKSQQEELALAAVSGDVSKVEEIVEAFVALYMGDGFRAVMRYRYDLDPRTLEITCVESPLADRASDCSPDGVVVDMFKGLSILHIACAFDQEQVLSYFLRYGAGVLQVSTPSGQTLLHTCAWYGTTAPTVLLVGQGACLWAENASGHTPLHLAALNGHLACLKELIKAGSVLDTADAGGNTALHAAALAGHFDCVKELLLYDAEVNAANDDNGTALHYSSTPALVALLVSFGADPTVEIEEKIASEEGEEDDDAESKRTAFTLFLERMPEGCEEILNKYLKSNGKSKGAADLEICLEYELFVKEFERRPKLGEIGSLLRVVRADRRDVLKHPVCESFLHIKWLLVRRIFHGYLLAYVLFLLALTALVLINFSPSARLGDYSEEARQAASQACFAASAAFACGLVLKTLISVAFIFRTYVMRSVQAVAELLMLAVVVPFLAVFQVDRKSDAAVHLAAASAFAAWFNFTLLLSNLPAAGIYINMIVHITKDAVRFLAFYASTLIAFGLGFHVLCHGGGEHDGEGGQFGDPVTSVLSTLAMMVGEVNYDVYFSASSVTHQGTTQALFAAFLLLVSIIMMNLLIGLAISNINTQFQAAGVNRLRMTVLLIRTLNNLVTVLRRVCPCCLRDINLFTYLRRKQDIDDGDRQLKIFLYPNKSGGDVFVKNPKGETQKTDFSLPAWVIANAFKVLKLDPALTGGNPSSSAGSSSAEALSAEKRQQEDRLNRLSSEIRAIRKDLQFVKAEVQNVAYSVKNSNKPLL